MSSINTFATTKAETKRLLSINQFRATGEEGIAALLDMLADPSWVVRRAVVETLASLGDAAVAPLCESLRAQRSNEARIAATVDALVASGAAVEGKVIELSNDANPAVVADVAQILGRRRSHSSIPVLIKLTRHRNDNVAVAAIEGLGRVGGRAAISALIGAIETGNFFRTFPAIDILGRSGDPRVVEPLTKLLENSNFVNEAARALGRSGERAAVRPLLDLLRSASDAIVRIAVVSLNDLLERFEEKSGGDAVVIETFFLTQVETDIVRRLARVLPAADVEEGTAICRLLGVIGNEEAAPCLKLQLAGELPVATSAAKALKRIGKGADEHLLKTICEGDSERRKVLIPLVSRASAAEALAVCLKDPAAEVRVLTCEVLAKLGNTSVVAPLFEMLGDPNLRVVHSATAAIQTLGSREARELAREAASSEKSAVRRSALNILSYFGDVTATEPMIKGLSDSDARVREAALQGLPYLEDGRAVEALFEACRSAEPRMRALALRALGQLPKGTERAYSILLKGLTDADAWARYYSCQALGRINYSPAAPEVSKLLEDAAGQVRVAAVEALSHLDSPEARAVLRKAATSEDIDVRRAALVGLGISHRSEDLPIVLTALTSEDAPTRLLALSALVRFPSPLVLGALSAAARDTDEQVRSAAIGFLGPRPEQEATEVLVDLLANELTRERAHAALLIPSAGRTAGLLVALEAANDETAPPLIAILGKMKRPEAKVALLAAMKLNNVAARKAAATGLSGRLDEEMLAALKEASENDPDAEVRVICSLLLRE